MAIHVVAGTLDSRSCAELSRVMLDQIRAGWRKLTLDVSGLDRATRSGIAPLVVAARLLQGVRGQLRICGARPNVEAQLRQGFPEHLLMVDADRMVSTLKHASVAAARRRARWGTVAGPLGRPDQTLDAGDRGAGSAQPRLRAG